MRTTTEAGIDVRRMRRPPTHPGEVLLEEFLVPLGLTQAEAARRMGVSTNRLNELVRAKRGVTAETALRLAQLLGTGGALNPDPVPRLGPRPQTSAGVEICRRYWLTCEDGWRKMSA